MTSTRPTFTACVTPRFAGLTPVYDVLVRRSIPAGIDGPTSTMTVDLASLDAVDEFLAAAGFVRVAEYGDVCANGYAEAPLRRDGETVAYVGPDGLTCGEVESARTSSLLGGALMVAIRNEGEVNLVRSTSLRLDVEFGA